MKDKYYTPSIKEFYIGFEYEWSEDGRKIWIEEKANIDDIVLSYNSWENSKDFKNEYRVKYLDKEDIENLGFKFTGGKLIKNSADYFENDKYFLQYLYKKQRLIITNKLEYPHKPHTYFDGLIKNKSELVKLMKQLNIK